MSMTPAARAVRHVDDGIGTWLKDLVTGSGSSPSHIIITGILGVIPGVGQVMDARDIILAIIMIIKSPMAVGAWIELVITLIGCVPAVGDALKVGLKLMKQGHNFGRVLEAVTPAVRGNVEKYMRKIDWADLSRECKGLFDKTIAAFIDGLDSWLARTLAGPDKIRIVIGELKSVQKNGSKMIDEAFAELKSMHSKMMGHELPRSTAAVNGTSVPRTTLTPAQQIRAERKLAAKRSADAKANRAAPNTTSTSTKKKAKKKKQDDSTGIPAEHLTDYFVKKKHVNFKKANNGGRLIEEWSITHNGLDHLWSNRANAIKPFVVGETKSSVFDSLKLIAALPPDLRAKFAELRAEDAATRTDNDKPNIFHNESRDQQANKRVSIGSSASEQTAVRRGVNPPNTKTNLPTQMSHRWIQQALQREQLTVQGQQLEGLIIEREAAGVFSNDTTYPYQRWISLVTGRQLHKHKSSKGNVHETQIILDLPNNILEN